MNGGRVLFNVAVFAVLSVVMAVWALQNVVRLEVVDRPYTIRAEFASSPGLHEGFEVAYLGVGVGKIKSIRLDDAGHQVVTELAIDRGVRLPAALKAAAGRKSAVGEPYVDLSPLPGADLSEPMRQGGVIPKEHTSVPVSYGDLFAKVVDGIEAVDPKATRLLWSELAKGLEGREGSLRQIIDGGDELTATFAERTELIDGLTKDLSRLTRSLAGHKDALGNGIDDTAAILGPLADLHAEIKELNRRAPGFTTRLTELVGRTEDSVGCALDALAGGTLSPLGTQRNLRDLERTLGMADELVVALDDLIQPTGVGDQQAINLAAIISTAGEAPEDFRTPMAQPAVPGIPACGNGADPFRKAEPVADRRRDGGRAAETPAAAPSASAEPVGTVAARPAAAREAGGPPAWLIYLPPLLALAVLVRVAVRSVPALARARRRRR
ncbi:MlaD family protein [Actinocorallia libanotica]|uniref:Phospholipid/cholesterol/gamma-HCH transport system substrate-binding protein n=1 Tax=Actinocorallia libanotica TaxID=46162 RepID=A0ABP4CDD7_9ACTN